MFLLLGSYLPVILSEARNLPREPIIRDLSPRIEMTCTSRGEQ